MARASKFTRKTRRILFILWIVDFVLLFLPAIIYVFIGLFSTGVTNTGRTTLVLSVFIAIVLSAVNVIARKRLRCPIWVLLLGLYVAIKELLLPLVIILAVTSILDDLVLSPAIQYFHDRARASKLIDDRMGKNVREEI